MRINIRQINIDISSNQIWLELIDCLFYFIQMKMIVLFYTNEDDNAKRLSSLMETSSSMEKKLLWPSNWHRYKNIWRN